MSEADKNQTPYKALEAINETGLTCSQILRYALNEEINLLLDLKVDFTKLTTEQKTELDFQRNIRGLCPSFCPFIVTIPNLSHKNKETFDIMWNLDKPLKSTPGNSENANTTYSNLLEQGQHFDYIPIIHNRFEPISKATIQKLINSEISDSIILTNGCTVSFNPTSKHVYDNFYKKNNYDLSFTIRPADLYLSKEDILKLKILQLSPEEQTTVTKANNVLENQIDFSIKGTKQIKENTDQAWTTILSDCYEMARARSGYYTCNYLATSYIEKNPKTTVTIRDKEKKISHRTLRDKIASCSKIVPHLKEAANKQLSLKSS